MVFQHRLTVKLVLHKTNRLKETSGLEPSRKATDPRKQILSLQHSLSFNVVLSVSMGLSVSLVLSLIMDFPTSWFSS